MTERSSPAPEPERTPDGRYIVVDGRRWRASDPSIPDALRAELVAELMAARRAVRSEGDAARHRVQDAKVALGERGEPWWEEASADGLAARVASTARTLLRHREGTICPSDVARVVGSPDWRERLPAVRAVAFALAERGEVVVLQGGEPVCPDTRGPIRLGRGPAFPGS